MILGCWDYSKDESGDTMTETPLTLTKVIPSATQPSTPHKEVPSALNKLYFAGNLLYATTNVYCLAIDLVNRKLIEIPKEHLEGCFCKKLAKITGMDVNFDHVYKKCELSTNVNQQIVYTCPFGLSNIIVPVFEGDRLVAALQAGPILTQGIDDYLRDNVLTRWRLSVSGLRHLKKELEAYPVGDVNYLIAISEVMAALMTCQPSELESGKGKNLEQDFSSNQTCSNLISSILSFITSNYAEDITLTDVAKHAYVNPSHLSRVWGKNMNCNFRAYLNSVRVEKAKELLLATEMSIADICNQVGFTDQSYFNKIFKKSEDMTPGEYRKSYKR